jgi:hypothetical protein
MNLGTDKHTVCILNTIKLREIKEATQTLGTKPRVRPNSK